MFHDSGAMMIQGVVMLLLKGNCCVWCTIVTGSQDIRRVCLSRARVFSIFNNHVGKCIQREFLQRNGPCHNRERTRGHRTMRSGSFYLRVLGSMLREHGVVHAVFLYQLSQTTHKKLLCTFLEQASVGCLLCSW